MNECVRPQQEARRAGRPAPFSSVVLCRRRCRCWCCCSARAEPRGASAAPRARPPGAAPRPPHAALRRPQLRADPAPAPRRFILSQPAPRPIARCIQRPPRAKPRPPPRDWRPARSGNNGRVQWEAPALTSFPAAGRTF